MFIAIPLVGLVAAQTSTVTVGPGTSGNGAVTLYGGTSGSVILTVNTTGANATTATLPGFNGNVALESAPPTVNPGDVVCAVAQDTFSHLQTGSVGSFAIVSGGANYKTTDTITVTAPSPGLAAAANITSISGGGAITGIAMTGPGAGYYSSTAPTYTIHTTTGSGASLTPSPCGPATTPGITETLFRTTYAIPANFLVTTPHLHFAAGFQTWIASGVGGPSVYVYANDGTSHQIYKGNDANTGSATAVAGFGTVWTWDLLPTLTNTPAAAGLICTPGMPAITGIASGLYSNAILQPVLGSAGINLQNTITLSFSTKLASAAGAGNALQLLWLAVEAN